MTVCAVHVFDKDIFMGADGLISNKYDVIDEHAKKIHYTNKGGDAELMYCLSGANGLIAAFQYFISNYNFGDDWWFNTRENYVDGLREFINVFIKMHATTYPDEALECLIACKQHFCCHKVIQHSIREIKVGQYAAIGCGDDFAMGALYSGSTVDIAIDAACKHSLHCGGDHQLCSMNK